MPIRNREYILGFIDPISIIGVLFLVVTLVVGTAVTTNKGFKLNIAEKAGGTCGYCSGATCVSCSGGKISVGECSSNNQCGGGGSCGNGLCQAGESPQTCPNDCMTSGGPYCGDGNCNGRETPGSCDVDCGNETPACQPSCGGRACGDDGCGDICGSCILPATCSSSGQCTVTCTPSCTGKQCGNNGCGGSCGTCNGGSTCLSNVCVVNATPVPPNDPVVIVPPVTTDPVTTSSTCGGTCSSNETCVLLGYGYYGCQTNDTITQCTPNCTNKCGGNNGCGGTCDNNCASGLTCVNNSCTYISPSSGANAPVAPIAPVVDNYDIESTRNRVDNTAKNIVIPPSVTTPKYTSKADCQANVNPNSKAYDACGQYATSSENQNVILQKAQDLFASISNPAQYAACNGDQNCNSRMATFDAIIPDSYINYWQGQTASAPTGATNAQIAFSQQAVLDTLDYIALNDQKVTRYVSNYQRINEQTYANANANYWDAVVAGARDKETLASTIDLGVTMTAEVYALTVAAPLALTSGGVVPGAVSLMGQAQVVSTAMQTGSTASYCAVNGWDEACRQQTARTGLSWGTMGLSQVANTSSGLSSAYQQTTKILNTVATGANFAIDSSDAVVAFSDPNADTLTRVMSVVAVVGDIGGGIMDFQQGQLGFSASHIETPSVAQISQITPDLPHTTPDWADTTGEFNVGFADDLADAVSNTPVHVAVDPTVNDVPATHITPVVEADIPLVPLDAPTQVANTPAIETEFSSLDALDAHVQSGGSAFDEYREVPLADQPPKVVELKSEEPDIPFVSVFDEHRDVPLAQMPQKGTIRVESFKGTAEEWIKVYSERLAKYDPVVDPNNPSVFDPFRKPAPVADTPDTPKVVANADIPATHPDINPADIPVANRLTNWVDSLFGTGQEIPTNSLNKIEIDSANTDRLFFYDLSEDQIIVHQGRNVIVDTEAIEFMDEIPNPRSAEIFENNHRTSVQYEVPEVVAHSVIDDFINSGGYDNSRLIFPEQGKNSQTAFFESNGVRYAIKTELPDAVYRDFFGEYEARTNKGYQNFMNNNTNPDLTIAKPTFVERNGVKYIVTVAVDGPKFTPTDIVTPSLLTRVQDQVSGWVEEKITKPFGDLFGGGNRNEKAMAEAVAEIIKGEKVYILDEEFKALLIEKGYDPAKITPEVIEKLQSDHEAQFIANLENNFQNNPGPVEDFHSNTRDIQTIATGPEVNKLVDPAINHLTGLRITDPELPTKLYTDQFNFRNNYNFPDAQLRRTNPSEYFERLKQSALVSGIEIHDKSLHADFFNDYPYAGGVYLEPNSKYNPTNTKVIAVNLSDPNKIPLDAIDHEITHAHQPPEMPSEVKEYEAYMVQYIDADFNDPEIVYSIFGNGIMNSTAFNYSERGLNLPDYLRPPVTTPPSLLAKVQNQIGDAWVNLTEKFKPTAKSTATKTQVLTETDFKRVKIDELPKNIQPEAIVALKYAQDRGIEVYTLPISKIGLTNPAIEGGAFPVGGIASFPNKNAITLSENVLSGTNPGAARIIYHEAAGHMMNTQVPRDSLAAAILNELLAQQTASLMITRAGAKPYTNGFNNIPGLIEKYKAITGRDPGLLIDILTERIKLPEADKNTVDALVVTLKMRQADIFRPGEASSEAVQKTVDFLKKYGVDTTDMSANEIDALINRLENPKSSVKTPKKSESGQTMTGMAMTGSLPVGLYFADQYLDLGVTDKAVEIFNNIFGFNIPTGTKSDKSIAPEPVTNAPEGTGQGANNLATYLAESEAIKPEDLTPPEGLTKTSEVNEKCQRVDRSNPCDGNRMYDMYLWYKSQPDAWWNKDGDFTPADFLALMLVSEAGGSDPEYLKAITKATSSQLWGSNAEHQAYCTTPDCEAGIFNFIGAYMQSASRRYNQLIDNPNGMLSNMSNEQKYAEYFAQNGLDISQVASDTIYNPVSKVYNNDTPVHWGNFGCGPECEYLGPNWIKDANQLEIQTGTTDRCGLYDMYGTDGVLAVVFTNNQKYNWTLEDSPCFK